MNSQQMLTICLCFLVFLNELNHVHLYRYPTSLRKKIVTKDARNELQENTSRRFNMPSGALEYLLKLGYEGLQMGAEFFADITSLVSIVSTLYAEMVDCKSSQYGDDITKWTEEAEKTVEFINKNSHKVNEMQLQTKNIQTYAESLNYHYNETLKVMEEIGLLSENLLYAVDPNLPQEISRSSLEVEEMVAHKDEDNESVDYAEITGNVVDVIDQSAQIAVPVVSIVVPKIPKVIDFAKNRLANLKGLDIISNFKNIKLPPINSKAFKAMSSWFSRSGSFIKEKIGNLRKLITTKYSKALKVAKGLKNGFFMLTGYIGGAFNIYNAVKNFKKCKDIKDQTWKALQKVRKAKKLYDGIWTNVTQAKTAMDKAAEDMIKHVTDDIFLEDLRNAKETLISLQGPGKGLKDMIDSLSQYIDKVKSTTDIMIVHNLMANLYQNAIGSIPFVYQCLIDKADFISKVVKDCKRGSHSLPKAIETARMFHNFQIQECEKMISVSDLSDEQITNAVTKAAEVENFDINCRINSDDTLQLICDMYCGDRSTTYTGKRLDLDKEVINEQIKRCPPCTITKIQKKFICSERKDGASDEEIQEMLPMLTIEQIQRVSCTPK